MGKYALDIKTNIMLAIEVEAPSMTEASLVAGAFAGAGSEPDERAVALLHRKVEGRDFELWADGVCDAEGFIVDERLVLDGEQVRACLTDATPPERKVRTVRRDTPAEEGRHLVEVSVIVYATTEIEAVDGDEAKEVMHGLLRSGRFEDLVVAQMHRNIDGGTYDEYPEDVIDLSTGEFDPLEEGIEGGDWVAEAMGTAPDITLAGDDAAVAIGR